MVEFGESMNSQSKSKMTGKSTTGFSRNVSSVPKKIIPQRKVQQNTQYIIIPTSANLQKFQTRLLLPSSSVTIPKQNSAPDLRTLSSSSDSQIRANRSFQHLNTTGFHDVSSENSAISFNENIASQHEIEQLSARNQFDAEHFIQTNFNKTDSLVTNVDEVFSGQYLQRLIEGDSSIYHTPSTNENEIVEISNDLDEDSTSHPYFVQISMPTTSRNQIVNSLPSTTEECRNATENSISAYTSSEDMLQSGMLPTAEQISVESPPLPVTNMMLDGHSSELLKKFDEFRKNGEFCDLSLEVGETEFYCHSAVVCAMSPLLHNLLKSQSSIGGKLLIKLDAKLDQQSIYDLLDILYTGQINLDKNAARKMLIISSYLKISSVRTKLENFYKSSFVPGTREYAEVTSFIANLSAPILHVKGVKGSSCNKITGTQYAGGIESSAAISEYDDDRLVVDENPANTLETGSVVVNQDANDVTKPRSSLTNLVRVASEAFKDLDQEENIDISDSLEISTNHTTVLLSGENQYVNEHDPIPNNEIESDDALAADENKCQICGKQFTSQKRYKNHLKTVHCGKNNHKCSYCGKYFKKLSDRFLHEQRIHTKEKPYKCEICEKKFCLQRELNRHLKSHKENNLTCTICNKKFSSVDGMKLHIAGHGEKKLKCRNAGCEARFATVQCRTRHEKSHLLEKQFQCNKCKAAFKSNHELTRHKLIHSGEKLFKCEKCFKSFSRAEHLKNHMLTHDENRRFECDKCGKTFKQKAGLNVHKKKHSAPFNYVCDICGYTCHSKGYLQLHSVTHSNERPFQCDICLTHFKAKKHLNRHKKIHVRKGETDAEKYKQMNDAKLKNSIDSTKLKKSYQANLYKDGSLKFYGLPNHQQTTTVLPSLLEAFSSARPSPSNSKQELQIQEAATNIKLNEELLQFSNSVLLDPESRNVGKNIHADRTNTPDWHCSTQEMQNDNMNNSETPMVLEDENYVPVLTAEDFL